MKEPLPPSAEPTSDELMLAALNELREEMAASNKQFTADRMKELSVGTTLRSVSSSNYAGKSPRDLSNVLHQHCDSTGAVKGQKIRGLSQ